MALFQKKLRIPTPEEALPGRATKVPVAPRHAVLGNPLLPPYPDGLELAVLRHGLLLGRGAEVLAGARRVDDGGRLRRRAHAEPDLRGGVQRA